MSLSEPISTKQLDAFFPSVDKQNRLRISFIANELIYEGWKENNEQKLLIGVALYTGAELVAPGVPSVGQEIISYLLTLHGGGVDGAAINKKLTEATTTVNALYNAASDTVVTLEERFLKEHEAT